MSLDYSQFIKNFKGSITLDIFSKSIHKVSYLFLMTIFGSIIDTSINGGVIDWGLYALKLVLGLMFVALISPYIQWISDKRYVKENFKFNNTMFNLLLHQEYRITDKYEEGIIVDRFGQDVNEYIIFNFNILANGIFSSMLLVSTLIYLVTLNWMIAASILLIVIFQALLNNVLSLRLGEIHNETQNQKASLFNTEKRAVEKIEGVKILEAELDVLSDMKCGVEKFVKTEYKFKKTELKLNSFIESYDTIAYVLVIAICLYLVSTNVANFEEMTMIIFLFGFAKEAVSTLLSLFNNKRKLDNTKERITDLYVGTEEDSGNELTSIDSLYAEDLHFSYRENEPVLEGLSIKIKSGQPYLLKGENGFGKSTFIKLLMRLYDNYRGQIMINGKELRSYSRKSIREQIAVSTQSPFLINETIYENIKICADEDEVKIKAVMKSLELDDIQDKLVLNYGSNLSGGEKQRISLARVMLKNASLYVFDEPYNALDFNVKKVIETYINNLDALKIIISHQN